MNHVVVGALLVEAEKAELLHGWLGVGPESVSWIPRLRLVDGIIDRRVVDRGDGGRQITTEEEGAVALIRWRSVQI